MSQKEKLENAVHLSLLGKLIQIPVYYYYSELIKQKAASHEIMQMTI
jgi:hypothetical protein